MIVESVNVGFVVDVPWGSLKKSAIDKRPLLEPVRVHSLGVGDDEIADLEHHGGLDQAVYAFAGEQLDRWATEFGRPISPGTFGENLTTRGIDVDDARIGDRWRIGTALLEVSGVRIPCSVFQGFVDQKQWVKRFTHHGRPGAYLRVLEEGELKAGDRIEIVEQRKHHLTVAYAFRALTTERHLLPDLASEPAISASIRRQLAKAPVN